MRPWKHPEIYVKKEEVLEGRRDREFGLINYADSLSFKPFSFKATIDISLVNLINYILS
jgi:hypothetical protein